VVETLNLSLPRQHDYTDPTVERDLRRLRDWLSNLPLMDVAETVRLVMGALDALNEQKLDDALRFDCLEAYRMTALRLFETLDPLYLRQLALPKARRREAIDGVSRVFHSLAGGYKLLVAGNYPHTETEPPALLGPAVNRALELLTYALLDCYRFYREPQPQLMAESHVLYRIARLQGLLGVAVADPGTHPPCTTAMLYHASMLLALTRPESLAEGEVGLLFDVLMRHADSCRVIPGGVWEGDGAGLFVIDLYAAAPPVRCTSLTAPVSIRDPYLLDASEALREISAQLAQTPARVRMQSPEAIVLKTLMPEPAAGDRRRATRHPDGRYVDLLLGLEVIHAWLLANDGGQDAAGIEEHVASCRVLDSSLHGMKLAWAEGSAGDVQVGDLVGVIESVNGRDGLRLAVARSILVLREGGVETGIELFPGGLGAVTCSIPGRADGSDVHALFMPADETGKYSATLLVEKGYLEEGITLLIDVGGSEVHARVGRCVMQTLVFDRFEFAAQ